MTCRPPATGLALALALAVVATACSTGSGDDDAAPAGPVAVAVPPQAGAKGSDDAPATTLASLRDADVTDVDTLAGTIAAGAAGDPDWIEVFAGLRARSWLAARYPGRYDLADIYRDEAQEAAQANEDESLDLGVWLDEPLPTLVSVTRSRELGELVELEVVVDVGPATVRGDRDDQSRGILPGGQHRGLFMLGRDGPGGRWRIHSVVELHVEDRATGQEPNR